MSLSKEQVEQNAYLKASKKYPPPPTFFTKKRSAFPGIKLLWKKYSFGNHFSNILNELKVSLLMKNKTVKNTGIGVAMGMICGIVLGVPICGSVSKGMVIGMIVGAICAPIFALIRNKS